jgi:hypothetical protein
MSSQQDFNRLYTNVSTSIATAMTEIADLKVDHKDGKKELNNIMDRLRSIQTRFDGELGLLEEHAEWDQFTMAFFGETNAGKSTIIESLRILFKEESRQQLLQQNANDLGKFEEALATHVNQVREGLNKIYAQYTDEIASIQQSAGALAKVVREETSARTRRKLMLFTVSSFIAGSVMASAIVVLVRS